MTVHALADRVIGGLPIAIHWTLPVLSILTGIALVGTGLLRDPARGRRRCPRCWHEMTGCPGLTCPECGRAARRERSLHRRRRRWGLASAGLLACAGGAAWLAGPLVTDRDPTWLDAVPTAVLAAEPAWLGDAALDELIERLESGNASSWTVRRLGSGLLKAIDADPAITPERRRRALSLLAVLCRLETDPLAAWDRLVDGSVRLPPALRAEAGERLGPLLEASESEAVIAEATLLAGLLGPDARSALPALLRRIAGPTTAGRGRRVPIGTWPDGHAPIGRVAGTSDPAIHVIDLDGPATADLIEAAARALEGDDAALARLELAVSLGGITSDTATILLSVLAPAFETAPLELLESARFDERPDAADRAVVVAAGDLPWTEETARCLERALTSPSSTIRRAALETARRHGPDAAVLRPIVRDLLDDRPCGAAAAWTLVAIGGERGAAMDTPLGRLGDAEASGRAEDVLRAIAGLGIDHAGGAAATLEHLRRVRRGGSAASAERLWAAAAAIALGASPAEPTRHLLEAIAAMPPQPVHRSIVALLVGGEDGVGRLDPVAAVPFTVRSGPCGRLALAAIWTAGPRSVEALPALRGLLTTRPGSEEGAADDDGLTQRRRRAIGVLIDLIERERWPTADERAAWTRTVMGASEPPAGGRST